MDLARMEQNEAGARRAQDYRTAEYWHEQVEAERLREQADVAHDEWDLLKGSPEHG